MEGTAQTLLGAVGQLVAKEYRQLRGVGGEVAELRAELATMNAILRVQSEADEGVVDHFIREWMKQVRELAYDTEDCVHLFLFRICFHSWDGVLVRSKRILMTLFTRRRLAAHIKVLRARVVAIGERHARYGISRDAMCPAPPFIPVTAVAVSGHQIRTADLKFIGMKEQVSILAKRVSNMADENNKLKVFFIVGLGGLGKTTLAREVCRTLDSDFPHQAQVSVSRAFDGSTDLKELIKSVLQQIEGLIPVSVDRMELWNLTRMLTESLREKRYLIIIDDVSTTVELDAIQSQFPDNNLGSRIIVTTRVEAVAKACSSAWGANIYHMKPLGYDESKQMFIGRVFGPDCSHCPKKLRVVMDSILKRCGGQPLAIITIAGVLASYNVPESRDMWVRLCDSICSHMERRPSLAGMKQILRLCYNHLPHYLKDCVMYLSIFPEGYVIKKDRLLNRWVAEGLITEELGLTMMETAAAYYNELISRSIIYPVPNIMHDQRVEACQVQGMMLEVIVSKSVEANFVRLVGGKYEVLSYDRIRRLTVHGEEQEFKQMNVRHVRSLSMFNLQGDDWHRLLYRLGEFTLMRVLDLEGCKGVGNRHIMDICRMQLLRFLNLRGTNISELSPRVRQLVHLQTLDVADTDLVTLPETVTQLGKLERMRFGNKNRWNTMWAPPPGIGRMEALREVDSILIKDADVARQIGRLVQLREIGMFLHQSIVNDENVLRMLADSLSSTYSLRSLTIGCLSDGPAILNFLLDLQSPPRLLRFLSIIGGLEELPSWVALLAYLNDIRMSWTGLPGEQVFGVLCTLPNLQNIELGPRSFVDEEVIARSAHKFLMLRSLSVHSLYGDGFPRVIGFEEGSMTRLETLSVQFGEKERSIVGIEHLLSLKEVQLTGKEDNVAMHHALEQLNAENERRPMFQQFKITARYES